MATQSGNIQKLLQAEKRAQDVISQARARKAARRKQGKDEAKDEVMKYKVGKEQQFKQLQQEVLGSNEQAELNMADQIHRQTQEIEYQVAANEQSVIDLLVGLVADVKVKSHQSKQA